jgi:glycosyltransferase involved in cell wall biosynthesis
MAVEIINISLVIATIDRAAVLRRTLESLAAQSAQPAEVIIIDASKDLTTRDLCVERPVNGLEAHVIWLAARMPGAASQRNQGVQQCHNAFIGFFDDDILFERDCIARLWSALQSDAGIGGVNAMITNQRYQTPGRVSRLMFRLMAGRKESTISYAGRVLGPAVNLLPEDRDDLPKVVPVQWLNTTCTLYRRQALPDPPFPDNFTGYSLMEDLSLSLTVGRHWKLANARTARIHHDSQSGEYKSDLVELSKMELVNRYFIMTQIMCRRGVGDYAKLALWELYQLVVCALRTQGRAQFRRVLCGKLLGLRNIVAKRRLAPR